ncbi:MAG: arabinose ABC transporter permease, partial [Chloroflexota bacterium]|nr:arabinose ABC transporter permease [Chloroflexota bacterium]
VLVLVGMSQSFAMVTMALMILKYTVPDMRGRVLGLRQLAVYGLPIGLLLSGYLAERNGVFSALIVNGVVGLVLLALSLIRWSSLLAKRKN